MFVRQEVTLDVGFAAARANLATLMHGDWLDGVSQDAYAEGLSGQLRVGPLGRLPGAAKLVEVRLLEPVPHDDVVVLPLRWEATGRVGGLFPVLDANLTLGEAGDGRAVLRFAGVYRPPLGALGQELDQRALHGVATATVKSLLRRIAAPLAGEKESGASRR